jgi:hypothetical protein
MQREQSIEDQLRVCEKLAERHGFSVVARFSDKALSGGTTQRPGYQQMLARRGLASSIASSPRTRRAYGATWQNKARGSPS